MSLRIAFSVVFFLWWCFKGLSISIFKLLFEIMLQGVFELDFSNGFFTIVLQRLVGFNVQIAFSNADSISFRNSVFLRSDFG